jgi:uncharacterized protein (UPF0335 family)
MTTQTFAAQRLRSIVERLTRLDADKKAVAADIGEVLNEAKGDGFDAKIIRRVMRLLAQDKMKRAEEQALLKLYLEAVEGPPSEGGGGPPPPDDEPGLPFAPPPAAAPYVPPAVDARDVAVLKGRDAARAGQPVTANPYPPGTPNRMDWDEAWCAETGTDGMDIPAGLKPAEPKPDDKPEPKP